LFGVGQPGCDITAFWRLKKGSILY